jgi:pimeloyl-ACP methyl ester carboxylesterase
MRYATTLTTTLTLTTLLAGAAVAKPTGQYADVNGLRMYYEIQGQGRPLVLLHGGLVTIDGSFAQSRPQFNKSWKTIAIEQQAHGHTNDVKDRPLTTEQMAEDTYAVLKKLGVDNADFFGWSMGGGIALQIAARHPEMVHKVAVSGTAFTPDGEYPVGNEQLAQMKPENFPLAWRQEYAKKNPDPNGFPNLLAKIKQVMLTWKGMKPEDIKAIRCPVLLMIGDADIVKPEHMVAMFRTLPNAHLAVLPLSDHFAPVQRTDWVVSMVKTFLEAPMQPPPPNQPK